LLVVSYVQFLVKDQCRLRREWFSAETVIILEKRFHFYRASAFWLAILIWKFCLSICLSVALWYCVDTAAHIKLFITWNGHHSSFLAQTAVVKFQRVLYALNIRSRAQRLPKLLELPHSYDHIFWPTATKFGKMAGVWDMRVSNSFQLWNPRASTPKIWGPPTYAHTDGTRRMLTSDLFAVANFLVQQDGAPANLQNRCRTGCLDSFRSSL